MVFSAKMIYAMMVTLMPLSMAKFTSSHARETEVQRGERYLKIATAYYDVIVATPKENLPFTGDDAQEQTAATMVGIGRAESGWNKDVDFGIGPHGVGDAGNSFCVQQILVGKGRTKEGWSGRDLVNDRTKCIKVSLRVIIASFKMCSYLPVSQRLAAYAAGTCKSEHGKRASVYRYNLGQKALKIVLKAAPELAVPEGKTSKKWFFPSFPKPLHRMSAFYHCPLRGF